MSREEYQGFILALVIGFLWALLCGSFGWKRRKHDEPKYRRRYVFDRRWYSKNDARFYRGMALRPIRSIVRRIRGWALTLKDSERFSKD